MSRSIRPSSDTDAAPASRKPPRRARTLGGSSRWARALIDAQSALLAFVGTDERYRLANSAHREWLGVEPEALVGRHVRAVFGGAVYAALRPHLRRALAGTPARGDVTLPWLDGSMRWVHYEITPDPEGLALRLLDVAAQKRARQELLRSEQDLADLLENAAEGMHWLGPDGTILWANRALLEMLGYTQEEYVGRQARDFHADPETGDQLLSRMSRHEALRDYETRLRCRDGSIRSVVVNANALWENGRFVHARCFVRDITERRVAELLQTMEKRILELVTQNEPLDAVLTMLVRYLERLAPDLLVSLVLMERGNVRVAARSKSFADAAPRLASLLFAPGVGGSPRLEPQSWSDLDTHPEWAPLRDVTQAAGIRACWVTPIVCSRNGLLGKIAFFSKEPRAASWRDLMLLASAAHVAGLAVERQRLDSERQEVLAREQEARQRTEKLAEILDQALRARDDFLSMASHELRNPINALQLQLLSVLRNAESPAGAVPQWATTRLKKAGVQIRRLMRLIDNLMDVSRMTSGRLELELEEVDLSVLVREVVDRSREEIGAVEVVLRTVPAVGHWDRLRLDQVATNLVSNAVKYGKGRPIEIDVETREAAAVLRVRDYGIGISPEAQQRIFRRFERAVATRVYSGFGLGLWITNEIVLALGGSVAVDSTVGQGSTFIVTLPLAGPSAQPQMVLPPGSGVI